ncbi:hypothetical protein [Planotetraspora sp. GP83]|uniref:hypothetical protein n=1 Tax=Planotetraspora sp. GP83 TaxID=3156264 RepID=UPI0035130349
MKRLLVGAMTAAMAIGGAVSSRPLGRPVGPPLARGWYGAAPYVMPFDCRRQRRHGGV